MNERDVCCCGHRYADHGIHITACIVVDCDCRAFCESDEEWDEYEEAGTMDLEDQLDRALDYAFPKAHKS